MEPFYTGTSEAAPSWGHAELVAELLAGAAGILLVAGYSNILSVIALLTIFWLAFLILVSVHCNPWYPSTRFPRHPFRGVFELLSLRVTQGLLLVFLLRLWILLD